MGFTDFDPDESQQSSTTASSSSGGGGGRSGQSDGYRKVPDKHISPGLDQEENYPFYCLKSPEFALVETDDGYEWCSWPEVPEVRYEKEGPDEDWEMVSDETLELVYWDGFGFKRLNRAVDQELGGDLLNMLHHSPEMALEAIELAERLVSGNSPAYESVSCECCDREYHTDYGDYHTLNGAVLCGCHTVEELKERNIV